jgi:hypothetical protein
MHSPEDLPVVLVWHPEGSRGSRHEFLFIVGCVINTLSIHGKKLLQIFSFLSNLYCLNAEGNSGAANTPRPPSLALNVHYASHPLISTSFLCCCLLHAIINYTCDKSLLNYPDVATHCRRTLFIILCHFILNDGGPGSSVGIAIDYGLDCPGSNPGGDEIFRPSRPALGPTQPPV